MKVELSFGWLYCMVVCVCVFIGEWRSVQTADSLLILQQDMWVQFISPGLTLMSYSTCRPDSAVALGNLLRK